jgi:polar amino acid transport system substrate-binding protein
MRAWHIGWTRRAAAIGLAVLALVGAAATARAGDLLDEIKARGFIRIGTFSIPPEAWIDIASGEWQGVDADFSKAIAKSLGVEVDPIVLVHAALAPALESGRVDAIAGLYYTAERAKVMAYNKVPFWYGVDVLIAQSSNKDIKSFADMKDKVLGTVRGSAQEMEASELQKKFGVKEIKKYESADPMLMDLKAGRLDAAIWWGYTFDYAAKQNPSYDFRVVQYMPPAYLGSDTLPATYYVFRKDGSARLIDAFDAEIKRLQSTGEAKQILDKYGMTAPGYLTGKQ